MKVLLISRIFPPEEVIGAVRPYQFAKYLSEYGHSVSCLVDNTINQKNAFQTDLFNIHRIQGGLANKIRARQERVALNSNHSTMDTSRQPKQKMRLVAFARRTVAQVLFEIDEYTWYRNALKIAIQMIEEDSPDILLTSYGPTSSIYCGLAIKRRYPNLIWVSDMRDPMDVKSQQPWRRWGGSYLQNKMLKRTDALTTVSNAIHEFFQRKNSNLCSYVIENGYVEGTVATSQKNDGILRIAYTGTLYNGLQDMSPLFLALSELEKEYAKPLSVEVHYAGRNGAILLKQAKVYHKEKYVIDHGRLSKENALALQEACDILCVLSWNTQFEQGVITGKFPEYLRLRKPILAIISGELPDAELSQRIEDIGIGFSYEQAKEHIHRSQLKAWLQQALAAKNAGVPLAVNFDEGKINEYSYSRLVMRLERVLNSLLKTKQTQGVRG